jgi:predicted enzyme related to lactoylglutathione lyase
MAAVTGLGGVLLRADDPEALAAWYAEHLGLERSPAGFTFPAAQQRAEAVLAFLGRQADSFPAAQPVMVNLQVDDLDGLLDRLAAAGVAVEADRPAYDFGRFGWFTDPEGNRVELWEPAGR